MHLWILLLWSAFFDRHYIKHLVIIIINLSVSTAGQRPLPQISNYPCPVLNAPPRDNSKDLQAIVEWYCSAKHISQSIELISTVQTKATYSTAMLKQRRWITLNFITPNNRKRFVKVESWTCNCANQISPYKAPTTSAVVLNNFK